MKNKKNIQYTELGADQALGSSESSVSMKKKIGTYTKRLTKVFDINKENQCKDLHLRTSKNIGNVDENIATTSSNAKEINKYPFQVAKNKKTTKWYQLQTKNKSSVETQGKNVINLDHANTSKLIDSDKKRSRDDMEGMENTVHDFNKANAELNTPPKDEPKVLFEPIHTSLDTNMEKKCRVQSTMSSNGEGKIKLETATLQDSEHGKGYAREQRLAEILSDNCLLENAIQQLRIKCKHFLDYFDMKTDTIKPTRNNQNYLELSSGDFVRDNKEKVHSKSKRSNVNILDTIEQSRISRRRLYQNCNNPQSKIPKRHFNTDGICMKFKESSILSRKINPVDMQKLRVRSVNFNRVFSKTDEIVKNFIPITPTDRSFNLGGSTTKRKGKLESVDNRELFRCKMVKRENSRRIPRKTKQTLLNSDIFTSKKGKGLKREHEIMKYSCGKEIKSSNDLKVIYQHHSTEEIERTTNNCKVSAESGKSLRQIEIPNQQTNVTSEYYFESDGINISNSKNIGITSKEGVSFPIGPNSMEEGSIVLPTEMNKSINDFGLPCTKMNKYIGETNPTVEDLNVSIRSNIEKGSLKDKSSILDQAIENSNSSTETAVSFQDIFSEDLEINKSSRRVIEETYIKNDQYGASPIISSNNPQEKIELCNNISRPEELTLPERRLKPSPSKNFLLIEGQTQKVSNMSSLPVGDDDLIVEPSQTISENVYNNLPSTCMYFDEIKTVSEFASVLLPEDGDMKDELEKLGTYEDFEKDLLHNTQMTSETNQTI